MDDYVSQSATGVDVDTEGYPKPKQALFIYLDWTRHKRCLGQVRGSAASSRIRLRYSRRVPPSFSASKLGVITIRVSRVRIDSKGDVPRVDLATLRRLVPPLWTEWADLEFTSGGWLRDPDTGQPLGILQLVHGRHRVPGAQYVIAKDKEQLSFVLTFDGGEIVRGTLSSQWWSTDLEIGNQLNAVGRADVGAVLRVNDVPKALIPLIGGREATGTVLIDPSALERGGDLVRGEVQAQRGVAEFVAGVKTGRHEWHAHMTVRVGGRGLLGRVALVAFRSKVRGGIREGLDELTKDTATEAIKLESELGELEDQIRAAGGEKAFVHKYLWAGLRELMLPVNGVSNLAAAQPTAAGAATAGDATRFRRGPLGVRRLERPVELRVLAQTDKYLVDHGSLMNTGELIVRPHGDRVKVHWPSSGRYDNPPVFHGVVQRQAVTMTVTGTIRETRSARTWSLAWGFATGLMALIAILGIYDLVSGTAGAYPPLLIGVIAGPIFALFWRGARKERRPNFIRQAGELEDGLQRWFTAGAGQRTYL